MGDLVKIDKCELDGKEGGYWGLYVIHAKCSGVLTQINYSEIAKECLVREQLFKPLGSEVHKFINSGDAIGLTFFRFPNQDVRDTVLRDFTGNHIKVEIR